MKILLSPAKSLDLETKIPTTKNSMIAFSEASEKLNRLVKKKSARSLARLMHISAPLAQLNFQRNQDWQLPFTPENSRQAIYAFSGDVYRGLDIYSVPLDKLPFLQKSIRIISGLYGLLKPLDLIQPYRLEMGTKLAVGKHKNLYGFWTNTISEALNDELEEGEICLNLASNEYFKAINTDLLKVPVVTAEFRDFKGGEYKSIMTYAKLARGYMTRYIMDHKVETLEGLKEFNYEGYGFSESLSKEDKTIVFVR